MPLIPPVPGSPVLGTWTDGITQIANGFLSCNQIQPSADYTLTAVDSDVPGANTTIATTGANAFIIVHADFAWNCSVAVAGGVHVGRLVVDSVDQIPESHGLSAVVCRTTTSYTWLVRLAAGAHTIGLRASKVGATTVLLEKLYTAMTVLLFDLP
jgi:hypothetical protein